MSGYIDFGINGNSDIAYENGKIIYARKEYEVIQRVRTRLKRLLGEWFLDINAGIPYYNGQILGGKDINYVRLTILSEINETKGVSAVNTLNILINPQTHVTSIFAEIVIDEQIYKITEEL